MMRAFDTRSFVILLCLVLPVVQGGCHRSTAPTLLESGLARMRSGSYEAGCIYLEQAVQSAPGDALALTELGIAYWRLGKLNDAVRAFTKASLLVKRDTRPLEFLGAIYAQQQNWTAARVIFRRALEIEPTPRILTWLAIVDAQAGENVSARNGLAKALQLDDSYAPAVFNLARLYESAFHDSEAAEKYYAEYIAIAPAHPRAADALRALRALQATHPPLEPRGGSPVPGAATNTAPVLSLSHQESPVVPSPPTPPTPAPGEQKARRADNAASKDALVLGQRCFDAGDVAAAIHYYQVAIEADPLNAVAFQRMGVAQQRQGDVARARAAFEQALEIAPDMVAPLLPLAELLAQQSEYDRAAFHLQQLIRLAPDTADAYYMLGWVYAKKRDAALTRRYYEQYVQRAPNGPRAMEIRRWLERKP